MIVRALSAVGDFTFGNGIAGYLSGNAAIGQNIQTRIAEWLGDCFFNLGGGVDWGYFLGSKDKLGLDLAIRGIILNTSGVVGISAFASQFTSNRKFSAQYSVVTQYGTVSDTYTYSIPGVQG